MEELKSLEFKDIRIVVPWGHIEGRWYGNRDVRPILAIHGWLDNLGTWDTIIPLLPRHVGILCVDMPGHGRSSKYPKGITYNVFDYVDIITRIMKEYNWQKVSLLGHSMGGIICFIYTSIYPHNVDMLIQIDMLVPKYLGPKYDLKRLNTRVEKQLVEDDRLDKLALEEPPSYTYEELKRLLYEGSSHSVDLENCKYILDRSITKSTKYPDKYYFSRDGKVKHYVEFNPTPELSLEMAKRIKNLPYLVVKGSRSNFITEQAAPVLKVLSKNNRHFEFHTIEGTHHVHLNNPTEVAKVLRPFISTNRPAMLNSWSVDDENLKNAKAQSAAIRRTEARGFLRWLTSKL